MNDPEVTLLMNSVRKWIDMPLADAKKAMRLHMENEGGFAKYDFQLLEDSESIEEAVGAVYGI